MLDTNFNLKIIDFGDAKKIEVEEEEEEEVKMDRATVAGSFCGTLNYISPEVFTHKE